MRTRRLCLAVLAGLLAGGLWLGAAQPAQAQSIPPMGQFYYYPYYYFPHNYWPQQSAPWPERRGEPYQRPPAYMAYPPFHEPNWRYEMNAPHSYYRGSHFWLDAF